jgi:hypothetical protein
MQEVQNLLPRDWYQDDVRRDYSLVPVAFIFINCFDHL